MLGQVRRRHVTMTGDCPQVIVFTIHGQIEGKAMNIIDDGAPKSK